MAVSPITTVQWIAMQARSWGEMSEKLSWSSAGSALQVRAPPEGMSFLNNVSL